MLRISDDLIDRGVIERWAGQLGLLGEWKRGIDPDGALLIHVIDRSASHR